MRRVALTVFCCGGVLFGAGIGPVADASAQSRPAEELIQRALGTAVAATSAGAAFEGLEGALVYLGGRYGPAVEPPASKAGGKPEEEGAGQSGQAPAAGASGAPAEGGALPPASAGTNGSYVAPEKAGAGKLTARAPALRGADVNGTSATYVSGIVLPPAAAPERVKGVINAANTIVGRPYVWGGGHGSWYASGYDCSGAVSFALAGGGFLDHPLASGALESWGAPGPGRWITVYANAGHAFAVIAGFRWDTVGDARGTRPRWHAAGAAPAGFVARHPPGY